MTQRTTIASEATSPQPLSRLSGTLTPRAPFDFGQTLAFMRRFTPMSGEQRLTEGALTKAVTLQGRAVVFSVWSEGTVEQPRLAYTVASAAPLSDAEQRTLRDRISFFLSLEDDLGPFYARAQRDSAMAPVIARRYGLHQPKFLTPFELACWAILTQRTPMPVARQIKERLSARYGPTLTVDGVVYRAFPEAATLAGADPTDLAAIVRNERKVEYLLAVIQLFSEVDEAWLRAGPVEEVQARLRATRGIGVWSTTFILVRGLGRMNAALALDGELERAAGDIYHLAPGALADVAQSYGDARGYWAFYCRNAFANDPGAEA